MKKKIIFKKGFSLIELILAFAILITLMILGFYVYQKVKIENAANNVISDLNAAVENYKSVYGTPGSNTTDVGLSDDTYLKFFDYMTKGIYQYKRVEAPFFDRYDFYVNKNSMVQFSISQGTIYSRYLSMTILVDQAVCEKIVPKLLASGNYMIFPNMNNINSSNDIKRFINKNSSGLGLMLEQGYNLETNYTTAELVDACSSSKVSSDVIKEYANYGINFPKLSYVDVMYVG